MLKISDLKTELIIFANIQQAKLLLPDLGLTSITFASTTSKVSTAVRDLGTVLDYQLVTDAHVTAVVKSCNFHLYQLSRVRHFITDEACKLVVHALVTSRLEFCSSLLVGTSGGKKNFIKTRNSKIGPPAWLACLAARGQANHV